MDSLLKHMVDMTGHRDHQMLDISVISAVAELASAAQARVLSIVNVRGQLFVRPRAVIERGQPARMEEYNDPATPGEPVSSFPALARCLAHHESSADYMSAQGVHTLWLPIWMGDKADTCLEIVNPTPYTSDTIHIIGGIVSVYRNFQNLLDYSERDSLTGLLNRKTFDDQLAKMLQASAEPELPAVPPNGQERRSQHEQERNWLAVVDVDHFKAVNDKFGHLYGDEVLILIANLLQSSFRAQDRVFRFGGEEFVVLLRSTTLSTAHKVFNRFRLAVQEYHFPQVGQVTVSLGFVSTTRGSPVEILGQADQALYYAKEHGRNQVCFYDDLVASGHLATKVANDDVELF